MTDLRSYIEAGAACADISAGASLTRAEGDALAAEIAFQGDLLRQLIVLQRDLAIALSEPDTVQDYGGMIVRAEEIAVLLAHRRP